jgi:hypothetical protein
MPTQTKAKVYAAKTAVSVKVLKDIRRWLIDNCKSRWSAADYSGNDFNWRKLGKIEAWKDQYLMELDVTVIVHFKKPEDLMLYLLSWPSEVLLND